MNRSRSLQSRPPGILLTTLGVLAALAGVTAHADGLADLFDGRLPNNFPFLNGAGTAATFSTAGFVDLTNQFHVPQGTNGRSCESCHLPQVGWSIRPIDVELKFLLTQGNDPIFNPMDANSPTPDVSSLQAKRASYSMLRKGLFRRGGTIRQRASSSSQPSTTRWAPAHRPRQSRRSAGRSQRRTSTSRRTSAGTTRTPTAAATCSKV